MCASDVGKTPTQRNAAFQVGRKASDDRISLINVPVVRSENAIWFAEAALPTVYADSRGSMSAVVHTGVGF